MPQLRALVAGRLLGRLPERSLGRMARSPDVAARYAAHWCIRQMISRILRVSCLRVALQSRHRRRFEGRSSSLCQQQQAYPQAAAYPLQPGLTPMMPTVVPTVVATPVGGTQGKYCGPVSWMIGIILFVLFGPIAFVVLCCPCDERPVDQH